MERLLTGKKYVFTLALYFADIAAFLVSWYLGFLFFLGPAAFTVLERDARFILFSLLILLLNNINAGLYKNKRNLFDVNEFMGIFSSLIITYIVIIVFLMVFNLFTGIYVVMLSASFVIALITTTVAHIFLATVLVVFRRRGYDMKRVVFFGSNQDLIDHVTENPTLGYRVIAVTKTIAELKLHLKNAEIVFITKDIDEGIMDLITGNPRINWKVVPSALNLAIEPVTFDEFKDYPIINVSGGKPEGYLGKRLMDIALSLAAIIILSPVLILSVLAIKIFMPGPIFFKQRRLGKNLQGITIYKFRTMVVDAEQRKRKLKNEVRGLFKMRNDPRVTRLGKFLRRTCIDELPQVFSILKGDMSIVGPRPHLRDELKNFRGWRMARFSVKPGLTGLWQVNGRHEINFDKAVLYDIYYVSHMSFFLDISIILKTVPSIILAKGRF